MKDWGDVASTTSLAHYFAYHATHHHDVDDIQYGDGEFTMKMADGSQVEVSLKSSYKECSSAHQRGGG